MFADANVDVVGLQVSSQADSRVEGTLTVRAHWEGLGIGGMVRGRSALGEVLLVCRFDLQLLQGTLRSVLVALHLSAIVGADEFVDAGCRYTRLAVHPPLIEEFAIHPISDADPGVFVTENDPILHPAPGLSVRASQLTEEQQIKIAVRMGLIVTLPVLTFDDSKREMLSE
ncbi:unnamed protein product [Schistocephalus solidus]|uniref:N-acetyltransferase domain-containing protein n=1 Tax=Schistocephalus solidus TaxID=70667 RepID=A0A183TQ19_SCHSO|nr:unnamed protein product [Schistocephalus solidus]